MEVAAVVEEDNIFSICLSKFIITFQQPEKVAKLSIRKSILTDLKSIEENFSVLKIRGIRIYMTGQVFNLMGDWMQLTAQTFFGMSIVQLLPAFSSVILKGNTRTLGHLFGAEGAGSLVGSHGYVGERIYDDHTYFRSSHSSNLN
jgi:hypothetical protein